MDKNGSFHTSDKNNNIFVLVIILASILAYSNSFYVPFIFDDKPNILQNQSIKSLFPLMNAFHPPFGTGIAGRPVINFTLAINYAISGNNVWSYHVFNLFVHILSALFLFQIIKQTLLSGDLYLKYGDNATNLSFGCAILWALHPLQTESVTYIIQRCESLMGLFFLMTVYFAICGWQSGKRWPWHLGAVLSFFMGIGCKEVIVAVPLILFLYQAIFIETPVLQTVKDSWMLYSGLAAGWFLLAILVKAGGTLSSGLGSASITLPQYAMTQPEIIFHYLKLSILPVNLCLDYAWHPAHFVKALPWMILMVVLILVTVTALLKKHPAGFPGAWFFIILAPSSSIVPLPDLAFDHRMYLSLAAVAIFIVIGGYNAVHFFLKKNNDEKKNGFFLEKAVRQWLLIALICILGTLTFLRNHDYRNRIAIWSDTVSKRPENPRAHMGLASALAYNNRLKESLYHYSLAEKISPGDERVYRGTGLVLVALGRYREAADNFEKALLLGTYPDEVNNNLGYALERQGLLREAAVRYRKALQYNPDYEKAQKNLFRIIKKIKQNSGN